jgi:hypothetical protein
MSVVPNFGDSISCIVSEKYLVVVTQASVKLFSRVARVCLFFSVNPHLNCILNFPAYTLRPGKRKEPDSCICPYDDVLPTVVLEVGDSESMTQLKQDARDWLESPLLNVKSNYSCYINHSNGISQVQLVVIICIDPPLATHPDLPRITIQHWKLTHRPSRVFSTPNPYAQQNKEAGMVWQANWTHAVTPYYIELADIFRPGTIPAIYGANTRAYFTPASLDRWRLNIIATWQ